MDAVAGLLGLVMGSAGNALIDRLPRGESWFKGRSHCDHCRHALSFRDLIPVVSYLELLYLKFKNQNSKIKSNSKLKNSKDKFYEAGCRYCHFPIPFRNVLVEIFLGLAFLLIFNLKFEIFNQIPIFQFSILQRILLAGMVWVTVVIAVMDWETKLVSEAMILLWGLLIISYQIAGPILLKFSIFNFQIGDSLLGLVIGVLVIGGLWVASKGRAMGFGDVEIAAVAGWWLGWPKTGVALWVAFVTGAIVGVWKIWRGKAGLKSEIPFGPFLIIGGWTAYLWGEKIIKFII